ncbi:MAG TPA: LLM class flavin-dependent oxidoreductase [Candidatus Sulfotelmatobacter sp.]|nr:LLM class flavin-dependent oxidoreductase [Candidatus Sulfotelmatobacter sp.]
MEFGMFHEFPTQAGRSDNEAFTLAMEQVDAAERWGLHAMWLAELHFNPARSVLSFPLGLAAAIAARTERMKIGMAVQVLPIGHPLRLAEEAATVDQLSRGRLIFGVGRSGLPRTYEAYGIPYSESKERFAEALEIIKLAWTESRVTYQGKFHRIDNVAVSPKPYQKPVPEIRVAATSPDTFVTNGTAGYPIFVAVRSGTFQELGPEIEDYRAAWQAAGHPGKGQIFLRVPLYVAASDARARAESEASILHFYKRHAQLLKDAAAKTGEAAAVKRASHAEYLLTLDYEKGLGQNLIAGSPDSVIEQLTALRDELGLDGILAELNCGGNIEHQGVMTALQLLCQEVMPKFH